MPRLQDIERFKKDLKPLGHENELLKSWGEPDEDVTAPEQGLSEDLSALIGDVAPGSESFDLPDIPVDVTEDDRETPSQETAASEASDEAAANSDELLSFLDTMDFGESTDNDVSAEENPAETPAEPAETPAELAEIPAEEDAFSLPEGLPVSLEAESDLQEEPEIPEEPEELESIISDEIPSDSPDLSAFDLPAGDFSVGDGAPEGESDGAPDDFSLPSFDEAEDLGMAGEKPAAKVDDGFSLPLMDDEVASAPDPEPEPAQAPPTEGSGAMDELSGFDLGNTGDDFDSFSLGNEDSMGISPGGASALGKDDLDIALETVEAETAPSDTFALESNWNDEFAIPGLDNKKNQPAGKSPGREVPDAHRTDPKSEGKPEERERKVSLSDEQADALQDTLLSYPLNLRLAIEETISEERGTVEQRSRLVWMLVEGVTAATAGQLASRILKRPIEIPKGFEKRTGAAFEAVRGTLPYFFIHTLWPVIRISLVVIAVAALVGWLGYSYIYKPLYAETWYARGYERIRDDRFPEAEEDFGKADKVWPMKKWYYRYAEGYAGKRQYELTEAKYEALLRRWPTENKAALDWSRFEKDSLYDYGKAADILKTYILEREYFHEPALLLLGETYLEWSDAELGNPTADLLERARLAFATLISKYGQKDLYLEYMLRYFMRMERDTGTDEYKQILPLKDRFTTTWKVPVAPITLAELGGYLLDRGLLTEVRRILVHAADADATLPQTHYQLARYYRRAKNPDEERKALSNAVLMYGQKTNLPARELERYIDALNWSGEYLLETKGEAVQAEEFFVKARDMYERALAERRVQVQSRFGTIYANLAEVYYFYRSDYKQAIWLFDLAAKNDYETPDTMYKRGWAYYEREEVRDYAQAVSFFYKASLDRESTLYLVYATANALYFREDYFAAQSYYGRLVATLRDELDSMDLIAPQAKETHHELVQLLMYATNNLGVTLFRIADRMGRPQIRGEGMARITESIELFDALKRDQKTMIKPDSRPLAFNNLDALTHPVRKSELVIERRLPRSMEFPQSWDPDQDGPMSQSE